MNARRHPPPLLELVLRRGSGLDEDAVALGEAARHLHLAVADQQGRTIGGHLAEGCTVRTTAEVVVAADDRLLFAREHDPATGYDELVVRERDP